MTLAQALPLEVLQYSPLIDGRRGAQNPENRNASTLSRRSPSDRPSPTKTSTAPHSSQSSKHLNGFEKFLGYSAVAAVIAVIFGASHEHGPRMKKAGGIIGSGAVKAAKGARNMGKRG